MKKLVFALVVLSVLAPFAGFAWPTDPNEIGLYTEPNGYGATGTYNVGVPVNVYLVLTKPTNLEVWEPISTLAVFETQLNFNPIGGVVLLADALPEPAINFGDAGHINDGYLEYIVGAYFPYSWPVTDESIVLITFTFINTNSGAVEITLGPVSYPTIPGQMVFGTRDYEAPFHFEFMYPISGSYDTPVFLFNGEAVAVENASFGSVKALYR